MNYLILKLILGLVFIPIIVLIVSILLQIVYDDTVVIPKPLRVINRLCAVSLGVGLIILVTYFLFNIL